MCNKEVEVQGKELFLTTRSVKQKNTLEGVVLSERSRRQEADRVHDVRPFLVTFCGQTKSNNKEPQNNKFSNY